MSLNRDDFHGYQERMVDWILDKPSCALFAEMGLGKTAPTLTALSILMDQYEVGKTLIIAPLRVARSVWPKEVKKWKHLRYLEPEINLLSGLTPEYRYQAVYSRKRL